MPEIANTFSFEFYGTQIEIFLADNNHWYIRLDHMCEHLGISVSGQRRRILENQAISDRYVPMRIDTPYQNTTREREVGFLDLEVLHFWLGTLDVSRVRADLQDRLILFQRDLVRSIWLTYRGETFPREILDEMNASTQAHEREIFELFEQTQTLRRKMEVLSGRLDEELGKFGLTISDLDNRLGAVETKVIGEQTINSQQAKQIQDMVSVVADALHLSNKSKYSRSTAHATVHNEFKQQFQVHVYSALPAGRFDDARDFLANWWQRLSKHGALLPSIFEGRQDSLF